MDGDVGAAAQLDAQLDVSVAIDADAHVEQRVLLDVRDELTLAIYVWQPLCTLHDLLGSEHQLVDRDQLVARHSLIVEGAYELVPLGGQVIDSQALRPV